ncbi:MFS transporter [soil metagenome]
MPQDHPYVSRRLALLFAVAGGAAVGNLYWAQPLLDFIADSLGVSTGIAGLLVTVTQVGYAIGVFLIVPLGDVLNRRRLIPIMMVCAAIALAAAAVAPAFSVLLIALAFVGLTTVAGQLLTPLAGELARPEERGRVVGTVVSGLLIGILLSRTLSGLVASAFGWRAIYVVAAVVSVVIAALLWRFIPTLEPRARVRYPTLILSVFTTVRANRSVPPTLLMAASAFGVFTMFWTALTFLLSAPPFSYSVTQIGLVGLVGLAGALIAQRAGRFHDRGLSVAATGAALGLLLLSLVVAGLGGSSIIAILVATILLDIGAQGSGVLNQTRLLAVDPAARSRLNTAFVTSNFIGGSLGSAVASILWQAGGWSAVMIGGAVVIGFAGTVWVTRRHHLKPRVG